MTKATHTPAPWVFDGDSHVYQGGQNANPLIAVVYAHKFGDHDQNYDSDTKAANARLIAAAPELLEALRDVVSCMETVKKFAKANKTEGNAQGLAYWQKHLDRAEEKARAAIAKAKGE